MSETNKPQVELIYESSLQNKICSCNIKNVFFSSLKIENFFGNFLIIAMLLLKTQIVGTLQNRLGEEVLTVKRVPLTCVFGTKKKKHRSTPAYPSFAHKSGV